MTTGMNRDGVPHENTYQKVISWCHWTDPMLLQRYWVWDSFTEPCTLKQDVHYRKVVTKETKPPGSTMKQSVSQHRRNSRGRRSCYQNKRDPLRYYRYKDFDLSGKVHWKIKEITKKKGDLCISQERDRYLKRSKEILDLSLCFSG